MKKLLISAVIVLSICGVIAGCAAGTRPGNDNISIVHTLCSEEMIGELPPDVSALNGEQAEHPCLLVGTISTLSDETCVLKTRISPSIEPSQLGDILSAIELPASIPSESSPLSDLWGIILCPKEPFDFEMTCIFPLEPAFGPSLDGKIVWSDDIWADGNSAVYIFPVGVVDSEEGYYFTSLMSGAKFQPAGKLEDDIAKMAICESDIGATIPIHHCGIAAFTILSNESTFQYSIQLEGFLKLVDVPLSIRYA